MKNPLSIREFLFLLVLYFILLICVCIYANITHSFVLSFELEIGSFNSFISFFFVFFFCFFFFYYSHYLVISWEFCMCFCFTGGKKIIGIMIDISLHLFFAYSIADWHYNNVSFPILRQRMLFYYFQFTSAIFNNTQWTNFYLLY